MPAPDIFTDLRLIKTSEEIEKIRMACRLADKCFEHVLRLLQPGVSEWDISLDIEFFFRRNMAEIGFSPIVASGHRSALPHGRASEKKLEAGDFVTLDFGAKLDGYCSDMTRTMVLAPLSERHKHVYDCVLEAQLAALAFMKPGVSAHDVDAAARDTLAKYDLAQYFGHGLGHGLGRNVHDGGRLGTNSKTILATGQVWTVEPGVYIEGFGGVRIEDDVVVTETGIESSPTPPKSFLSYRSSSEPQSCLTTSMQMTGKGFRVPPPPSERRRSEQGGARGGGSGSLEFRKAVEDPATRWDTRSSEPLHAQGQKRRDRNPQTPIRRLGSPRPRSHPQPQSRPSRRDRGSCRLRKVSTPPLHCRTRSAAHRPSRTWRPCRLAGFHQG